MEKHASPLYSLRGLVRLLGALELSETTGADFLWNPCHAVTDRRSPGKGIPQHKPGTADCMVVSPTTQPAFASGVFMNHYFMRDDTLCMGQEPLLETQRPPLPLLLCWEHGERATIRDPGSGPSLSTKSVLALVLNFSASRIARNKCGSQASQSRSSVPAAWTG